MSEEAKQAFIRLQHSKPPWEQPGFGNKTPAQQLQAVNDWIRPQVQRANAAHPVTLKRQAIGGVRVDIIEPAQGVSPRNRHRVLISFHGGGYFGLSAVEQGLLSEAVPIAGYAKIRVISVDYRLSPKYKFPAATEDGVAVYKELLKTYPPQNIGLYGCSTGAHVAATVVARLQKEKLPRPGALGLLCQGATDDDLEEGDSHYVGAALMGQRIPAVNEFAEHEPYMVGTDPHDPSVAPTVSLDVLSRFPPTLLISGTRDTWLSSVLYTHARLIKAGVEADLHVWDGMWHGFLFGDTALPESQEAYEVMTRFFDSHLRQ